MSQPDFIFKIILIGPINAGKSSILARYCDNVFNDSYLSTIGVDFKIKTIHMNEKVVKLQIWDTAGQERFQSLTAQQYRGCHGVVCVFDSSDFDSYLKAVHTLEQAIQAHNLNTNTIIMVSNKSDLTNRVSPATLEEFI